jgi:hypothetical protein
MLMLERIIPRMPAFRAMLALVIATGITTGLLVCHFQRKALAWTRVETRALTVLRSEPMVFLVMDRVVAQIVISSREHSVLLGQREGYLIATVRLYFGVDMADLTPANLRREHGILAVTIPEPRELDFAIDLDSLSFLSKRNGTVVVRDWLEGRDLEGELRARLKADARAFMSTQQLIPARSTIVARLNTWAPVLSDNLGVDVRFE